MRRVATLYRSTVGKKILMALSGLLLFLFIIGHMLGNLKVFEGPDAFNAYAEGIRTFGYPFLPEYGFLWLARLVLLGAVGLHILAAVQLWQRSRGARARKYRKETNLSFSYASRTMRWGGVLIFLFVVYHILHMTTGQAHPDFVYGDVYANFIIGFQSPLVVGFYLVAQVALCLHLYHGIWSMTQSVGATHPKYDRMRRPVAGVFATGIFIGFIIPPMAVLLGLLS